MYSAKGTRKIWRRAARVLSSRRDPSRCVDALSTRHELRNHITTRHWFDDKCASARKIRQQPAMILEFATRPFLTSTQSAQSHHKRPTHPLLLWVTYRRISNGKSVQKSGDEDGKDKLHGWMISSWLLCCCLLRFTKRKIMRMVRTLANAGASALRFAGRKV